MLLICLKLGYPIFPHLFARVPCVAPRRSCLPLARLRGAHARRQQDFGVGRDDGLAVDRQRAGAESHLAAVGRPKQQVQSRRKTGRAQVQRVAIEVEQAGRVDRDGRPLGAVALGVGRGVACGQREGEGGAARVHEAVLAAIAEFTRGRDQTDDITIVIAERSRL